MPHHHLALRAVLALLFSTSCGVAGEALELTLPLACRPGSDCWVVHLPDHDPGPGLRDHRCGELTYQGHDGTDFAIPDEVALRRGVPVLAAAEGRVVGTRDGEPDLPVEQRGLEQVAGRECGNGVAIMHTDGIRTQYCHLRRDSITVVTGQEVARGQPLGMVGQSGLASFPHLHFELLTAGDRSLDPFTGGPVGQEGCGPEAKGLWEADTARALAYVPTPVTGIGLVGVVPDGPMIWRGPSPGPVRADAPQLVAWLRAFGVRQGDRVTIEILDPDGRSRLKEELVIERSQARAARWVGLRRRGAPWEAGTWRVTGELTRDGVRNTIASEVEVVAR